MRYLFRGLIRETARPVEGHVEADTDEAAFEALAENGIVTESLQPDPKPLDLNQELPQAPQFADALASAFDSSSSQVDFDALTERYHGKKVWVIDRDKIRRRVAQVIDAALALSAQHGEHAGQTRERVANAIQGLFSDNRNIASERNAESVAGMRFNANQGYVSGGNTPTVNFTAQPIATNGAATGMAGHPGLESQIARMAKLVQQAEAALAAVSAAARRGGGGGDGPRRRSFAAAPKGEEQNSVLLEIFKSNLALVRGQQDGSAATAPPAPPQPPVAVDDLPPESSQAPVEEFPQALQESEPPPT